MKKYLFLLATLISLASFGQTAPGQGTAEIFVLQPSNAQRVHASDSVLVFATLSANRLVSNIGFTQLSGQALKINPVTTYYGGGVATAAFWLQGLAPGLYVFKATGLAASGTTGSVLDSLTVIADPVIPVCPICPPIPPARTATAIQITINGQVFTIPLVGTKITYSDGTVQ